MTQNFTWVPVRCTSCGWRGQKPATWLARAVRVICPQCGHTGDAPMPEPPARQWPPALQSGGVQ